MTRPRSLADELAELVNPAPQAELDPEAAGIGEADALGGSDDELAGLVGAAAAGRRAIPADIALEGGEYQGRRSSRAALFGGDEQQQDSSSEEEDNADGDSDDAQQQLGGVRLSRAVQGALPPGRRDLSTIPTMFANGHAHHGPGLDDPTSSSSLFSDEGEEEGEEAQQQQQQQQVQGAVSPVQQQAAAATVARVQQQQQQQGEREKSGSSSDDEGGSGQEDQAEQQQQQQQLDQEAAEGSSSEEGESEQGSEEEHDDMGAAAAGSDEDDSGDEGEAEDEGDAADEGSGGEGDAQMLGANGLDVDAAAAGVAAMLGDDEEMQQLEREAAAAQAEAAQQLVAAGARSGRDAEKAAGVRAQQRLWGAALELRIRLQRALAGGNSLPRPAARAALAGHSPQVARGYSELLGSCQATLQDMLTLHHSLAQQHPAAAAALAAAEATQQQQQQQPGSKSKRSRSAAGLDDDAEQQPQQPAAVKYAGSCRTADEAWSAVDAAISNLAGFRDASLDKWHRRTVLSSGTAALRGSSGLRALQQSVSSQVAALMGDSAKLVARSQLPLELAPRPLGTPARAQPQPGGSDDEVDADDGRRQPGGGGRRERARDAETYDEGDFYQQLLKELLEAAPPGSLPQQLAGARPPKRRKLVDRRASKGRKLRYHVMEKLVGFMAPAELVAPPFAEQLFGNLFSHQG
ncbi:hypothetical protein OEZ85_010087 [Tetradesmus obliquus]|uniref:Apoptosis-antagonizing transcription factor C-terminal domain-containing protein n=1 Tax=Tetradesmus obliquus TaxID=3088 RepID=A0ABY8TQX1_TETOB|nr:hypothetical protein OEZ85_010087 [Tetradesmus obliquus]